MLSIFYFNMFHWVKTHLCFQVFVWAHREWHVSFCFLFAAPPWLSTLESFAQRRGTETNVGLNSKTINRITLSLSSYGTFQTERSFQLNQFLDISHGVSFCLETQIYHFWHELITEISTSAECSSRTWPLRWGQQSRRRFSKVHRTLSIGAPCLAWSPAWGRGEGTKGGSHR